MTWFDFILIGLFVIGMITSVVSVGRARKPLSSIDAAFVVLIDLFLIWGVIFVR